MWMYMYVYAYNVYVFVYVGLSHLLEQHTMGGGVGC